MSDPATIFLKLGGSLITDKRQPETPRLDVLRRLAGEIAAVRQSNPALRLILGHGSGSFGHVYGQRYRTRQGVTTAEGWYGFAATADAAARLNRIVMAELLTAGLPAWSIQPSVALRCVDGKIVTGPQSVVEDALTAGLLPVVFGDVALDEVRGGTIASTEEIFEWLARSLQPQRIVLAGEVDGVYTGDPTLSPTAQRVDLITPGLYTQVRAALGGSHGVDVTGGMAAKVEQALDLVRMLPRLEVIICSGLAAGQVRRALLAAAGQVGTRITAD
ncbi:MAG TPA: isopentenyl phosphate kinase [Caldilineaceae bacterium]|nr:isopentenyl phosphate kinase [Caldilineaceae bacterium]